MTKVFGPTRVFFAVLMLFFSVGIANAQSCREPFAKELTFVANDDELNVALEMAERGIIGSVAISQHFYQEGSSKQRKALMRGLIARTFELGDRAVYIYGSPLDVLLANELLDGDRSCPSVFALGKLPNGRVVCMFVGTMSEDAMRSDLRNYDKK